MNSVEKIFSQYIKTIDEISFDNANNVYMTESKLKAVDFDTFKTNYFFRNTNISSKEMRSNDALFILNEENFIFIEFKNGDITSSLQKEKIRNKITESLLILNDVLEKNLTFDRSHIDYILVYNTSKNGKFEKQRVNSLTKFSSKMASYAKKTFLIAGFDRYKIFFHDVKTVNEKEFEFIVQSLENNKYNFENSLSLI
ncbi:MAG: hypothetical protein IJD23_01310 [Spirochaetaceae bacterium]|nr:hypothetical protein [Spirochaetaceae bacterium]